MSKTIEMNKHSYFLTLFFLLSSLPLIGQNGEMTDDEAGINSKKDINIFLIKNTRYPLECLKNNIAGDVVFSLAINKAGLLDSLALVLSPDKSLTTNSFSSLRKLAEKWRPVRNDSIEIDKKYLIVFRYRIFVDNDPPDYQKRAENYLVKQNYEKALKLYDKAVQKNIYDQRLYAERAEIKKILGDEEGALQDLQIVERLENNILALISITAIKKTRTVKIRKY